MVNIQKLYHGRKRAKEAVQTLQKIAPLHVEVFVVADGGIPKMGGSTLRNSRIILQVACDDDKADLVKGALMAGEDSEDEFDIDAGDCLEYYQGVGVIRFGGRNG